MQSFSEGLVTDAGMTERQALQVAMYFASFMNVYVVQHEVSDEAGRARNDLGIVTALHTGLGRRFWEEFKTLAPDEAFVGHVEGVLTEYDRKAEAEEQS